ncbi:hypothetical protein [Bacteroides nordii]|uniref:hypothetical protein n=1 Tax=Bacteroides nordii TaxID=291645 RepID=UPI00399B0BA4
MKRKLVLMLAIGLVTVNVAAQTNYFKKGTVNFAPSSHQDIAWMNVPDTCTEFRIEKLLMPSIRLFRKGTFLLFYNGIRINVRGVFK